MAIKVKKNHQNKSAITEYLEKSTSKLQDQKNDCFLISFKHLDKKQGASLYEWEQEGKLAHTIDVLSGYCQNTLESQFSDKFVIYGAYPSSDKAGYKCPTYISEDANWGRIHITGKQIVAGHIVDNVFYVVFLDSEHQFYKTDLQNR